MELATLIVGVCGFFGLTLTSMLLFEIRKTRESIEALNEKMAVIISKVEFHETRIDRLENHLIRI